MRNEIFEISNHRFAHHMAHTTLPITRSLAANTTPKRPQTLLPHSTSPLSGLHRSATSSSPPVSPYRPVAARSSLRRSHPTPPYGPQGGLPGYCRLFEPSRRWWDQEGPLEEKGDPGCGPPAIQFGVTLSAARRRPVVSGPRGPSRAATLSSALRPSWRSRGDPVLRPPPARLGVTLPAARLRCCAAAAFPSQAPCRQCVFCRTEAHRRVKKKKIHTRPRRRPPNRLRVTLSLSAG